MTGGLRFGGPNFGVTQGGNLPGYSYTSTGAVGCSRRGGVWVKSQIAMVSTSNASRGQVPGSVVALRRGRFTSTVSLPKSPRLVPQDFSFSTARIHGVHFAVLFAVLKVKVPPAYRRTPIHCSLRVLGRFFKGLAPVGARRNTMIWWRRRELNPRPPVRCLVIYMLSFRQLI